MRIVHYTLGIYPHRVGGLNRYASDLMMEQSKEHEIFVIIPRNSFWGRRCSLNSVGKKGGVTCYHLKNAMPLPLFYGISNPKKYINREIDKRSFEKFYNDTRPEILHLHSIMGLTEDVLTFFRDKGVKIVFSTHDYFGICPKVNLINANGLLCLGPNADRCKACNSDAPSTLFVILRNSETLLKIRDIVRWIKSMLHF